MGAQYQNQILFGSILDYYIFEEKNIPKKPYLCQYDVGKLQSSKNTETIFQFHEFFFGLLTLNCTRFCTADFFWFAYFLMKKNTPMKSIFQGRKKLRKTNAMRTQYFSKLFGCYKGFWWEEYNTILHLSWCVTKSFLQENWREKILENCYFRVNFSAKVIFA